MAVRMTVVATPRLLVAITDKWPSIRKFAASVSARKGGPSAKTIQNLLWKPPGRYGIGIEFARQIAEALDQPLSAVFSHPDGSEVGVMAPENPLHQNSPSRKAKQ